MNRGGEGVFWLARARHHLPQHRVAAKEHGSVTANKRDGANRCTTPYYTINPETTPTRPPALEQVRNGLVAAVRAGFGTLLRDHAPIICLLERKTLHDTLLSWTITPPARHRLHRLHQPPNRPRPRPHPRSRPPLLNDALVAYHVTIPDDRHFYSPWRATERPAFGFLHAC